MTRLFARFFAALAMGAAFCAGPAAAQSFDCAKASSTSEKLICASPGLSLQDQILALQFRRALTALPDQRDALLTEQRQWLRGRDAACAQKAATAPGAGQATPAQQQALDCLDSAYGDRIKALAALMAADKTDPALCRRVVELYRSWAGQSVNLAKRDFDPYDFLTQSAASGGPIRFAPSAAVDADRKKLLAWAAKQQPPFGLPDDLIAQLGNLNSSSLEMVRAPGTDFYAAQTIGGTAHCYASAYFSLDQGKARPEPVPPDWSDDEGASCGASRYFGALDGQTVAFELPGGLPSDPHDRLTLMAWSKDHFQRACEIDFAFTPHIDAQAGLTDPDQQKDECVGENCAALKAAAQALVEQVQAHGCAARDMALAALTAPQMTQWQAVAKATPASGGDASSAPTAPDCPEAQNLTDSAPLALPLVFKDRLLRADIGHQTVGWRIYSDWIAMVSAGKRQDKFYFGMVKGPEVEISVK